MIPVYICDDETAIRSHIAKVCENTLLIEAYGMEISTVTGDPQELLTACRISGMRGVYFLDVDLKHPDMNGFDLAAEIRRIDPRGFIIFVTTHGELAMDTFQYRLEAMDYIVKDEPEKMDERIARCLQSVEQRLIEERVESSNVYTVKVFDEIHHIPVRQILYFETSSQKHRLLLHADTMVLEFFGNLQKIEESIGAGFWRCHRSYLVNRERIRTVRSKANEVELDNGFSLPLSRKARKEMSRSLT